VSAVAELVAPSSGLLSRCGGGRGRGGAVLFLLCRGQLQAELAVVVGALNQGHHVIVLRLRGRLEDKLGASHFGYKISDPNFWLELTGPVEHHPSWKGIIAHLWLDTIYY